MLETGVLESKKDEPGLDGIASRWLKELDLAKEREKHWLKDAKEALEIFSNQKSVKKETFNMLWANTETKRPALYNAIPEVDIRRRFRDKDPVGRAVSDLLERVCEYIVDCSDLDFFAIQAVNDMLLSGRAVTCVVYDSEYEEVEEESEEGEEEGEYREKSKQITYQDIRFEQVAYDDVRIGPGNSWKDVPWIAFRHKFTKDEIKERFPNFKDDPVFNDEDKGDRSVFRRMDVWKIWDKDERQIVWICEDYTTSPLAVEDDPLELKEFFPCPRPLYAIENPTSTVPICEYSQYGNLAKELEKLSKRINKIIDAVRYRGVYDSTIAEMQKLFESDDNEFIPSEDTTRLISEKGIQSAIWTMPVKEIAEALVILKQQRRDLVQEIYEVTGISDIMRGATNPHETRGAQEIKANFGSGRLQRQQQAVQVYLRDIIRIVAEIAAENFTRETFTRMTGIDFPTEAEKQAVQMQMMIAQQMGQQVQTDPILQKPSWEEVEEILKNDFLRSYRVDIETDSTIKLDEQRDKQNTADLMKAIADFSGALGQAVQNQALPQDAPNVLLKSIVRKFKLGRDVEDAFDQPPQRGPGPEAMRLEQEAKMEQQRMQMEMQAEQQRLQMEMQANQQKMQMEQQKHQMELQQLQAELQAEREKMQIEREKMMMSLENERLKGALEAERMIQKQQLDKEAHERKIESYQYDKDSKGLKRVK